SEHRRARVSRGRGFLLPAQWVDPPPADLRVTHAQTSRRLCARADRDDRNVPGREAVEGRASNRREDGRAARAGGARPVLGETLRRLLEAQAQYSLGSDPATRRLQLEG